MGTNRTESGKCYTGVLVPHRFTEADLTSTLGTHYSITDPYAGPVTTSATSRLALEAAGDFDDDATSYALRVVRSGGIAGGVSWLGGYTYSKSGGAEYVRDSEWLATAYHGLTSNNVENPHAVVTDDGTVWVAYQVGGTSRVITVHIGGGGSDVVVYNDSDACCLCLAPDGSLRCYVADQVGGALRVYAADPDAGNTWTLVQSSAATLGTVDRMRATADASGAIGLWVVEGNGGTATTTQYASADGGYQFVEVAATTGAKVWDARLIGGVLLCVTGENPSALSAGHYLRRASSVFADVLAGDGAGIAITTTTNLTARNAAVACIAGAPWGRLFVMIDHSSGILGYRSDDAGLTWTSGSGFNDPAPGLTVGASTPYGHPTMWWHRDALAVVTNDAGNGGMPTQAHLHMFGGRTTVPATADASVLRWDRHFDPSDTLANHGYAVNDVVPAGGRTLAVTTGQYITAAAGGAARNDGDTGTTTACGVAIAAVRPDTGGTMTVRLGGDDAAVKVDVTQTQIRAYDATGAAGSYANHGVNCGGGEYVEVFIALDGTANLGTVWYRKRGTAIETARAWTRITPLTGLGSSGDTSYMHRIEVAANTSGWCMWAGVGANSVRSTSILAPGTIDDTVRERAAIPMLNTLTWLDGDVYVRAVSGVPAIDGVTHTIRATSLYPIRNAFPARDPSPSRVWRGRADSLEALEFAPNPAIVAPLLGVYLDGLSAVEALDVVINGASPIRATLSLDFVYDGASGVVTGSTSGSLTSSGWVRRDELAGWGFVSDDGSFAVVTGNTEGALVSGSTTTRRASIMVANDGATAGDGKLLPPRALVLIHKASSPIVSGLAIDVLTVPEPDAPTHEIGILAIGPVEVLPEADLNTSVILDDDARVTTYDDGSRRAWRKHRDRRRVQLGWVASHHDPYTTTTTSPDYIATATGSLPVATWEAVSHQTQGIVEAADGDPVVVALRLPQDTGTGQAMVLRPLGDNVDLVYGRIVGGWRREALGNVGEHGRQTWRIPPIVVEEEL